VTANKSSNKKRIKASAKKSNNPAKNNPRNNSTVHNRVVSLISRAFELYSQNRLKEVIEHFQGISRKDLRQNKKLALEYYRLSAFSLANLGQFREAEEMARKGLLIEKDDSDFYFVLAYVSSNFKEYDKAKKFGRHYVELTSGQNNAKTEQRLSAGKDFLVYNYLGVAYKTGSENEKAEEYFRKAIADNPEYHHPYLNLGNLLLQIKEFGKAQDIIADGLENCKQVQELEMMKKALENRATISVCMIVKNEEELLPNCLESVRNWVDEVILVDTGSTDRTVEIGESYGARIYHQEWTGNFSEHRNYSISKATKDWILIIDADEEIVAKDVDMMRQALTQNDYPLIMIDVFNMEQDTGRVSSHLPSIRLFRNGLGIKYDGIVHNQLEYDKSLKPLKIEAALNHYGYNLTQEKMNKKFARTKALLEKQLEENPDFEFAHYNLAQLYASVQIEDVPNANEKIKEHALKAIDLTKPSRTIHLMAHYQVASANYKLGNHKEAEKYALKALEFNADYLDPIILLGNAYVALNEYDKAEKYYKRYLETQQEISHADMKDAILMVFIKARHIAYYNLGLLKEYNRELNTAEEYFLKTLEETDPFEDTYLKLARVYLDQNQIEKSHAYIEKELTLNPDSDRGNLYKAEYLDRTGDRNLAIEYAKKAMELTDSNFEVFQRAGIYYQNIGQFDKAIIALERALEISPSFLQGRKRLGEIYYQLGEYGKSQAYYLEYMKGNPGDAEVLNDLANCYFKLKDYPKAEKAYSRALETNEKMNFIYRNLGLTKLHLNKHKEALTLLEKYSESNPEDMEIESAIGLIYCRLKKYGEAIPHFEKYLKFNPRGVDSLFNISECYLNLGYSESAVIGYKQILKIDPDFQPAIDRLGQIKELNPQV
jgi:tetratricopeptide (TPR) repeat protein